MNRDPRVRDLTLAAIAAGAIFALILAFASLARAEQPECVGDRHYDGVACCPSTEPAEPCEPEVCKPVLPCPDTAPCPTVTCRDGADGKDGTTVVVDRCPEAEVSEVCKVRRNGTVVCPRSRAGKRGKPGPRKIYVPRSIVDKIADVERY